MKEQSKSFVDVPSLMGRFLSDPGSLLWILFSLIIIILFLAVVLVFCPENARTLGPALLSASVVAVGWIAKKVVDDYENARSITLALVSDVAAIMTVIAKAGIAQHFILQFATPGQRFLWADVARDEDYFSVFNAHVAKLGMLRNPEMAAAITRFYTFLKASRDATSPLLGVKKGSGQVVETPQTSKAAEKKPEDPDTENHRRRMISVSVCEILEITFDAGKEVIKFFESSPKDAAEKLEERKELADKTAKRNGIKDSKVLAEQDLKDIEQTRKDIGKFLNFWRGFWDDNRILYAKDHKQWENKISCKICETRIFKDLMEKYCDIEGLRKCERKPEPPDGPSGG
jgi:hypothetical protein